MSTANIPDDFIALPLAVPDVLEAAFEYDGDKRWVAFYWEPAGDELAWTDGQRGVTGANWQAYLEFTQHHAVWPTLAPFNFGSSEEPACHWLVLDRQARRLYAAPLRSAHAFLAQQATPLPVGLPWEIALDELLPPAPTPEEICRYRARQTKLMDELRQFLAGCSTQSGVELRRC